MSQPSESNAPSAAPAGGQVPAAGQSPAPAPPSPEILKAALKAFKKRLKVMQLDDDSRIGRSPMSGGQRSTIAAIMPPNQYPREVWEELVKQGKLRHGTHGMYSLA